MSSVVVVVLAPLAHIIAEAGKIDEITIKNINEIVILFIDTSAVTLYKATVKLTVQNRECKYIKY